MSIQWLDKVHDLVIPPHCYIAVKVLHALSFVGWYSYNFSSLRWTLALYNTLAHVLLKVWCYYMVKYVEWMTYSGSIKSKSASWVLLGTALKFLTLNTATDSLVRILTSLTRGTWVLVSGSFIDQGSRQWNIPF